MKKLLYIIYFVLLSGIISGQIEGDISFISSQHYYVRFGNTDGLSEGDTLYNNNNTPALMIKYLSVRSCACIPINANELTRGDKVYGRNKKKNIQRIVSTDAQNPSNVLPNIRESLISENLSPKTKIINNPIIYNARLSVQNYSTYSNNTSDVHRSRYTLSGKLENLSEVITLSTYLNYTKDENFFRFSGRKRFNVYDLNINYHSGGSFNLWLGRYLNSRVSSLSTIDGLQAEKKGKNYFVGMLAGSRPDFSDMGYNIKLLEYGVYAGRADTLSGGFMENTMAFFQQTSNSAIDRRFIYLQHQNNIFKDLYLFLSSEIDLYAREKGKGQNKLTTTSIFFNSRYSPLRTISFSLSYDARKNVIYYETFRHIADSILDKETRQGLRLGINVRPFTYASFGINAGYRYKKGDIKPSRNIGGYFSYSSIPFIKASGSVNVSKLSTGYLDGLSYGIYFNKDLFRYISAQLNIRRVEYSFTNYNMEQNIFSADISYRFSKILFLLGGYEVIFEKNSTNHRILFDITARL